MNVKQKSLYDDVLKTHAILLKKHEAMVKADKNLTEPTTTGAVDANDLRKYIKAHNETVTANTNWVTASKAFQKSIEVK